MKEAILLVGNRRWGALLLAAAAVLVGGTSRAEPAPTNFELVRNAAYAACADLVDSLGSAVRDSVVAVRGVSKSPGSFLVENTLSKALTDAGYGVSTRADSVGGHVIEFEVADIGLSYPRAYRKAFFGRRHVEREARARIFARLVDQSGGRIVWAEQAEAKQEDEVAANRLHDLEETNPPDYLKATVPSERWNKLVEPVVVTGIIAGLIVLFFSNQSSN